MLDMNSISEKFEPYPHLFLNVILVIGTQHVSESRVIDPPKGGRGTLNNSIVDDWHLLKLDFLANPLAYPDTHCLHFVDCDTHISHTTWCVVNIFYVSSINVKLLFIIDLSDWIMWNLKQNFATNDQERVSWVFLKFLKNEVPLLQTHLCK